MMTLQQVAQAMLDRHGYFVIGSYSPIEIGTVEEWSLHGGDARPGEFMHAKYKVIAKGTASDLDKQYAIAGGRPSRGIPPTWNLYRAVCE